MAVAVGQRCVVRIKITGVELRNAKDIVATVESPQYVAHCQEVSFDEVSGLVYVAVDVNSAGSYSMWLEVRFAEEVVYTPAFIFAEVEGDAKPCDVPYVVDVEVQGESVSVTPPKIDVDAVTREEFEQLSKDVANKVDKVAGKGLSTNDYTDAEKAKVAEIDGLKQSIGGKANTNGNYPNMTVGKAQGVVGISQVQEALTLTTKTNGNIVIGNIAGQSKEFMPATPSGDPMHYAYEAAGAVWNANTGFWEMYDMKDVTNEQMRRSYNFGHFSPSDQGVFCIYNSLSPANIRFNLPRTGNYNAPLSYFVSFAAGNWAIEILNLTQASNVIGTYANIGEASSAFLECTNLRRVMGILNLSSASNIATMFKGCRKLEDVQLLGLKADIFFADSPLSVESATYMIANANASSSFTITFRADRQTIFEANSDFIAAKSAKPNITILYQ